MATRARDAVGGVLHSRDFTLRLNVTPPSAAEPDQVRGLRVDIVFSVPQPQAVRDAVQRAVSRTLGLRPSRGDAVIFYAP